MTAATARRVTCRMVNMYGDQCTGEALDATAEVLICAEHTAKVMRMVNEAMPTKRRRPAA